MNFQNVFFLFVKVCEKELSHFRKLKVLKNCLFAKTYAPNFLKNQLQQSLTAQKTTVVSGCFFVFASMFEYAPKVISTGAAFFTKRLGFTFTNQTDVRSSWGEKLRNYNLINGLWKPFWQFYWIFLPRVQTYFNSNSKNFLRSHKLRIILKNFLTNIAALSKSVENMKGDI